MFDYIVNNLSTIIVGAIVFAVIGAVVGKLIRDKKNHRSSCGCSCAGCPSSVGCRQNTKL